MSRKLRASAGQYLALWLALALVIVEHPRYSSAPVGRAHGGVRLAVGPGGGIERALAALGLGYLGLGLGLVLLGTGFVKMDLNALPQEACELLGDHRGPLISSYPRLTEQLRRTRAAGRFDVITVRSARHFSASEQLAPVEAATRGAASVLLLTYRSPAGSVRLTNRRLRAHFAGRSAGLPPPPGCVDHPVHQLLEGDPGAPA